MIFLDFLGTAKKLRGKYFKNLDGILDKKNIILKIKGKCEFCDREGVDIHHISPKKMQIIMIILKHFIKIISKFNKHM